MTLSLINLRRFIRIRNKSMLNHNLQFQCDLEEAGLRIADLGPTFLTSPVEGGYHWKVAPHGVLHELRNGQMELRPE